MNPNESRGALVVDLLTELMDELKDHARVLAEFAAKTAPQREPLIETWRADDAIHPRAWYENAAQVLLDALQSNGDAPDLDAYLKGVAAWSRTLAASGTDYATAVQDLYRLRRAALTPLLTFYTAGPELQLVFDALDALDRVLRTIVAEAFIETAQAQLRESARLRTVGHLTQGIAHSLNNRLAAILGRAQLLEQSAADETLREGLREIENAAHTAADSLRRLQEYAAARTGEAFAAVDVNAVVNDAVQLTRYRWRDDAEANGIVIDVIKDFADVPPVQARRRQVCDALVELVLNAVEAMPLGGLVTVRTERVGERARVSVSDLGAGMDASTRAAAGAPFFTTKGAGHVGLGLVTAASIAQEHNGALEIESELGRGTTVTLALPLAPAPLEAQPEQHGQLVRGLNILVVDDDASIREIARKSFELHGHRVQIAESGTEALEIFREGGGWEVVLSDLGMPGMNGLEVARTVKRLRPETVVILMTGWAAELDPRQLNESGVDRAIHKPFDVEDVLQLIGEALAKSDPTVGQA
jgi:signal transduction histidine kinase/ActR/RegA family two-component response regulator